MNEPDIERHSFIVKLWLETRERDAPYPVVSWRGRVTHVPSGIYRYFQDIDEITQFIRPYLGNIEKRSFLSGYLKHLRSFLKG